MSNSVKVEAIIRPIRDSDVETLGKVHAQCWHETYDHLISSAALENLSPKRVAELWSHLSSRGPEFVQVAAVVNGEIVGFAGAGPARDSDAPRERELYFMYVLSEFHGTGVGQKLFDAVISDTPSYLWIAADNPRAHSFYERNGFISDGGVQDYEFLGEILNEVRLVR